MSNPCRRFRTTIRVRFAKLLIRHVAGAVAEGRQLGRTGQRQGPVVTAVVSATRPDRRRFVPGGARQAAERSVASRRFRNAEGRDQNAGIPCITRI